MTTFTPHISVRDYDYHLPAAQIAQYPLAGRDASKLLVFRNGEPTTGTFSNIGNHLPGNGLLIFNDTKVIRARLQFQKTTGARIEIFCLEPISPFRELQEAFLVKTGCTWKCLVGNIKRWRSGKITRTIRSEYFETDLTAEVNKRFHDGSFAITFSWNNPSATFADILDAAGVVPLPPYIQRVANEEDTIRYQTVYAENKGSVAAPTAGLHFTKPLLTQLRKAGFTFGSVTLHVGVGTFRPVTSETIAEHEMHSERIVVSRTLIRQLLAHIGKPIVAVGTTSARAMETLYWMGTSIINGKENPFITGQWDPYNEHQTHPSATESLRALENHLAENLLDEIQGDTRLLIMPGYQYKIVTDLITNFHMPQSTLLLLVAALVGEDWRKAYAYALENGFRFLSYGDSCLFLSGAPA